MATPGTWNIEDAQAATFQRVITLYNVDPDGSQGSPVNLTGATASMSFVRNGVTALAMNTSNGQITLGGSAGTVTLTIAASSNTLSGIYQHELFVTLSNGQVIAVTNGFANFLPEVGP